MGHNHPHSNNTDKNLTLVFFLNSIFVIIELVGGLLTNSIAILSDALHDFGDSISLAIAWFLQRKSKQGRDAKFSYGYKRFSLLGAVFLSGILCVSSVIVIIEAIKRMISPVAVSADGMFWLAILGVVINGIAALRIKKGTSLNERSVYLHIMEDVLGWLAVLIASIIMKFIHLPILDPILSICISVWVLFNVYKNLIATFKVFLQATPEEINLNELETRILAIEDVISIHDLHIWSLDGESHVMTLHVVCSAENTSNIKQSIINIGSEYHIVHTTIEFEHSDVTCNTSCD